MIPKSVFGSAAWQAIASYANEKITSLREDNDSLMAPEKTALLRGQILALKELLAEEMRSRAPIQREAHDQIPM